MVVSSCRHCLFVVSVECRAKVRDAEASVALPFTDENFSIIKFVCNDLYISRIHCSPVHWPCYLFSRDRVSDDLTFRAVLLVGSSEWTFSFWASLRRTLTSFCALHGGFPNPGALERSWALKWSLGLTWYFNCSSRRISYDVSSWPSLLKCTFVSWPQISKKRSVRVAFYCKSKIQMSKVKSGFCNRMHPTRHRTHSFGMSAYRSFQF